jgi:hypothetical protein
MTRRRAIPLCLTWLSGLVVVGWWLMRLGGRFAAPPLDKPDRWLAWVSTVGPVHTWFTLLRLACMVTMLYLVATLVLEMFAQLTGAQALRRASDIVSIALVRRIVNGTIGMGLTAGALAAGGSPVGAMTRGPVISQTTVARVPVAAGIVRASSDAGLTMRPLVQGPPMIMRPTVNDRYTGGGEMTMRAGSGASGAIPTAADPPAEPAAQPGSPPAPLPMTMRADPGAPVAADPSALAALSPAADPVREAVVETKVLEPGDHLWAVAEERVARVVGRPGTDGEVTAYWQRLIQFNRADLADPDNPDLVFPGQTIRLPPG